MPHGQRPGLPEDLGPEEDEQRIRREEDDPGEVPEGVLDGGRPLLGDAVEEREGHGAPSREEGVEEVEYFLGRPAVLGHAHLDAGLRARTGGSHVMHARLHDGRSA